MPTFSSVDDGCPEESGKFVESEIRDGRVRVLFNERNLGVGGAVKAGYRAALAAGAEVVVKLDGDGQMDPALIPLLVEPVLAQLPVISLAELPTTVKLNSVATWELPHAA